MKRKNIRKMQRTLIDLWLVLYILVCPLAPLPCHGGQDQYCNQERQITQEQMPALADRPRDTTG